MRHSRLQQSHQLVFGLAGALALAGCFSCGGGGKQAGQGDAGKQGFSRCIEDWPSANGPHPTKPSLNVEAPRVVWRTEVPWAFTAPGLYDIGPVISKDRLAFPTTDYVFFVGKDGSTPQKVGYNALGEPPSGLAADPDGNVYYVTQGGVYSVDAAGKLRWQKALGGSGGDGEYAPSFPPVLGPDGVVYAVTSSDKVYALRTSDGSTIWSQPAPGDKYPSKVMGGAGRALFLVTNSERTDAIETGSGSMLGSFIVPEDGRSIGTDWGHWVEGWDMGIAFGNNPVFDQCGSFRWSRQPYGRSGVIAAGELMVVAPPDSLALYNASGEMVAGSAPARGRPMATGSDGTIYTVDGRTVLAYSLELKELWRIDLGSGAAITGMVVLDDDGVMYLMHQAESTGTELVAIQTRSPGLADSSWPSIRHDNRGTAWLVPGVPSTATPSPACSVPHRNGELRGGCPDLASWFVGDGGGRTTA